MTYQELLEVLKIELRLSDVGGAEEMGKTRGWDSLRQVSLMFAIEQAAGTSVPPDMFGELTSVEAIWEFLAEEGLAS